ncbi:MAG: adenosylmethionine decarboxylase [Bdellovibrionales bacterium]
MSHIFEGAEKKLELVVREGVSLFSWPEQRFFDLVEAAGTKILSKIENSQCKAYLLSESSLFVWDDRITMITCGQTTLVNAALKFQEFLPVEDIDALVFERKNEYFPQYQKTDFYSDIKTLNNQMKGKAYRFGDTDEHYMMIFHSDKIYRPRKDDTTLEILMYGLTGKAREIFNTPGVSAKEIREATQMDKIFPEFQVDDYAFSPIGYSLNAIRDSQYFTIHVTPQDASPYVSFETNLPSRSEVKKTLNAVLEVFRPRSFDVVFFDTRNTPEKIEVPGYYRLSQARQKLACGYAVSFGHFSEQSVEQQGAIEIEIR